MDLESLKTSIEALGVETRITEDASLHISKGSIQAEGYKFKEIYKIDPIEYCLGAVKGEVSLHQVCLSMFKDVLVGLPKGDTILYWRTLPVYEEQEEFATGKMFFRVRFRVSWFVED